jgi:competence protein ComEA
VLVFVAAHFVSSAPAGQVTVESASGAASGDGASDGAAAGGEASNEDSDGEATSDAAPQTPTIVVVDVAGAVRRPGLYRLPHGDRIADAIARAGGATRGAQTSLVNLAAPLADGEQVLVPSGAAGGIAAADPAAGTPSPTAPVNLNAATAEQLDALPGVGPVTAQKIIDYRTEHGSFTSVDDLDAIPGIGPAKLAQLRDLVSA